MGRFVVGDLVLHSGDPKDEAHLMRVEEIKIAVGLVATEYLDIFAAMQEKHKSGYKSFAALPDGVKWLFGRRYINPDSMLHKAANYDLETGRLRNG